MTRVLRAQSPTDMTAYTKSWTGLACQNQSIRSNQWSGIGCADGRVTYVRLSGAASGSLDGFGQLTALEELHLEDNKFNGKSPSTCLPTHMRLGICPDTVYECLPGRQWPCALPTAPCQAHERGVLTVCTGAS